MQYIHYLNDFTLDINLTSRTTGLDIDPSVIRSIKFFTREGGRCYKCCFKNNTLINNGTTITAVLNGANLEPGVLRYVVEIEIPNEIYPDSYKKILQEYVSSVELVKGNGSTEDIDVQVMFGDTIDDKFNSYDASILAIEVQGTALSSALTGIQELNSVQDVSINRIEEVISTIDGGTSGSIDRLDTSVNALSRDVSALNRSVDTLSSEQETMSQNLSNVTNKVNDISTRFDGFETVLAKKADVSLLGNYYTTGETYTKTEVDRAIADAALDGQLPAGVVVDADYVHTDNNYTTEDKNKVRDFDLTGYPTNSSLVANYATKAELQNVDNNHPTNASVNSTYLKKTELADELTDYVQNTSLVTNYATKNDISEFVTIQNVSFWTSEEGFITDNDISAFATERWVNENYCDLENIDEIICNVVDNNYTFQNKVIDVINTNTAVKDIPDLSTNVLNVSTKLDRDYLTAQSINRDFVKNASLSDYTLNSSLSANYTTKSEFNEVWTTFVTAEQVDENYAKKDDVSTFVTSNDVSKYAEADLVNQQIQALQNILKSIQTETPELTYDASTTTVTATGPETITMRVDGDSVVNPYTFQDSGDMYHEVTATSQAEYKAVSDTASLIVANFTTFYDSSINYTLNSDKKTVNLKAASPKYSGDVVIPEYANHANASFKVVGIPNFTFSSCAQLTDISIPKTVTTIGDNAIYSCGALASISIDSDNRYYDSRDNCNAIIETATNTLKKGCNNSTIPNSVTSIADSAFSGTTITQMSIPNSVTSIGAYAFSGCSNLANLTLPNSLITIGEQAFSSCRAVTNITIPNTVTTIGDSAFQYCGLVSINIPSTVTSIGQSVFYYCESLTSATLSSGIETMSKGLFSGCTSLSSCIIPNTVTTIGDQVFSGCTALSSIVIPNSVTSIGKMAFQNTGLSTITIPNSVTSIGDSAYNGCTQPTSITIPASVTSIGGFAFAGCSAVTSITVNLNNTTYDSRDNCNAIIETATNKMIAGCINSTIPSTVTEIAGSVFSGCTGLSSITIPDTVTTIGSSAFRGSGLTSITIPNSVTRIEQLTFGFCNSLTTVVIGSGVTFIGQKAFQSSDAIQSMTILATTPPTLQSQAAALGSLGATSLKFPIYVPAESVSAYKTAFTGYKNRIQAIPES